MSLRGSRLTGNRAGSVWSCLRFAHGLTHRDFIPQVVHVSVRVQNLGTITPKLALWWTDKLHAAAFKFYVLAVQIVHLNRERDFLSG